METLPYELCINVFSFLDMDDKTSLLFVGKEQNEAVKNNLLWGDIKTSIEKLNIEFINKKLWRSNYQLFIEQNTEHAQAARNKIAKLSINAFPYNSRRYMTDMNTLKKCKQDINRYDKICIVMASTNIEINYIRTQLRALEYFKNNLKN